MVVETVFLVVLVVSLVIGNVLLSFIPSNGSNGKNFSGQKHVSGKLMSASSDLPVLPVQNFAHLDVLSSNFSALNTKMNLVVKQMEQLNSKLRRFDNFRANTEIEVKALKEIIVELQNRYITVPSKKVENGENPSASEMKKLIYRSR